MKRALLIVALASSFAYADNCYVFDKSTQEGLQHYYECKEQAAQLERQSDKVYAYVYQTNQRSDSYQGQAQQDDSNVQLQAILRQLQERQ